MTVTIGRRELLAALGGAAIVWPITARAQQPGQLPIIGYMGQGTAAAEAKRVAALVERLREHSWIEGRTVVIEFRWTDGRSDLAADIAAEFVRRKVDIIVTSGTPLIVAAKQATGTIPIVFSVAGDPVGSGLVASLARCSPPRRACDMMLPVRWIGRGIGASLSNDRCVRLPRSVPDADRSVIYEFAMDRPAVARGPYR